MQPRTLRILTILLALVPLGAPGSTPQAAAGEGVPLKGRASAVITAAQPEPPGVRLQVSSTGQATHLGRFSREESLLLTGGSIAGTLVFTAANGDQLSAEVEGGFTSATTAEGTYSITGGTGRFADSSGAATFTAITSDGLHFEIAFQGTISF